MANRPLRGPCGIAAIDSLGCKFPLVHVDPSRLVAVLGTSLGTSVGAPIDSSVCARGCGGSGAGCAGWIPTSEPWRTGAAPVGGEPGIPSKVPPRSEDAGIGSENRARASSPTAKYGCNSTIFPSRFQVFPEREISASRPTIPDAIHCCSVASSRQLFCSPVSRRMSHNRSDVGTELFAANMESASGCAGRGGSGFALSGAGVGPAAGAAPRTLNRCPQCVHLTVTPPGLSRLSSSSYSVWHFSQRTSMGFQNLPLRTLARSTAAHTAPRAPHVNGDRRPRPAGGRTTRYCDHRIPPAAAASRGPREVRAVAEAPVRCPPALP